MLRMSEAAESNPTIPENWIRACISGTTRSVLSGGMSRGDHSATRGHFACRKQAQFTEELRRPSYVPCPAEGSIDVCFEQSFCRSSPATCQRTNSLWPQGFAAAADRGCHHGPIQALLEFGATKKGDTNLCLQNWGGSNWHFGFRNGPYKASGVFSCRPCT